MNPTTPRDNSDQAYEMDAKAATKRIVDIDRPTTRTLAGDLRNINKLFSKSESGEHTTRARKVGRRLLATLMIGAGVAGGGAVAADYLLPQHEIKSVNETVMPGDGGIAIATEAVKDLGLNPDKLDIVRLGQDLAGDLGPLHPGQQVNVTEQRSAVFGTMSLKGQQAIEVTDAQPPTLGPRVDPTDTTIPTPITH